MSTGSSNIKLDIPSPLDDSCVFTYTFPLLYTEYVRMLEDGIGHGNYNPESRARTALEAIGPAIVDEFHYYIEDKGNAFDSAGMRISQ